MIICLVLGKICAVLDDNIVRDSDDNISLRVPINYTARRAMPREISQFAIRCFGDPWCSTASGDIFGLVSPCIEEITTRNLCCSSVYQKSIQKRPCRNAMVRGERACCGFRNVINIMFVTIMCLFIPRVHFKFPINPSI